MHLSLLFPLFLALAITCVNACDCTTSCTTKDSVTGAEWCKTKSKHLIFNSQVVVSTMQTSGPLIVGNTARTFLKRLQTTRLMATTLLAITQEMYWRIFKMVWDRNFSKTLITPLVVLALLVSLFWRRFC
jgi:hypothetical protein